MPRAKESIASKRGENFGPPAVMSSGAEILRFPELARTAAEMRQAVDSRGLSNAVKRAADIVVSSAVLAILSVPLLVLACLVRLTSAGPAIFRQKRTGLNGREFTILKFRSMYVELQDQTGVKHTVENDPRVTPLGKFMRKYSLDELPQFLNVLRGDMSIVGPRAHAVGMLAMGVRYDVFVPDYDQRHLVKPGITGQAQIRGYRGEINSDAHARGRIAEDLDYVRNMSLWRDIKIMALTIPAVISGHAAV